MVGEIKQKEFCRITGLTRKALLIYEQKGILTPCRIDHATGYRFYSDSETDRGVRIALLRSLDFTVPEIERIICGGGSVEEIMVQKEQDLYRRRTLLEQGLRFIDLSRGAVPFSPELQETKLALYQTAVMEGRGTARDIAVHLKHLSRCIRQYGAVETGSTGAYFFTDSCPEELHFKVFVPVSGEWLTQPAGFQIENFGAPRFLFVRHYGTYERIPHSYASLQEKIRTRGELLSGEYMEIYRNAPTAVTGTDTTMLITDIGVPQWY